MRVSVSLSDRERHDWRNSAACRDMDPRDFDDGGTPVAWNTCRRVCEVLRECRADCKLETPRGVYRAGRYWPEKYGQDAQETAAAERHRRWQHWAKRREQGWSLPRIGRETGHDHTTVLSALKKMGVA